MTYKKRNRIILKCKNMEGATSFPGSLSTCPQDWGERDLRLGRVT